MDFILEETKNTPKITFKSSEKHMNIVGRSFPENAKKVYQDLFDWADSIKVNELTIDFYLYYISSSSVIALLDFLKKISGNISSLKINWSYDDDDDDMKKIGEDYALIIKNVKFSFFPLEE